MFLVQINFTHYGPKDSETGIKEFILVNDLDKVLPYVDKKHMSGYLKDAEEDGDESDFYAERSFWRKNPTKRAEAKELGLVIKDGFVRGKSHLMTKWFQGTGYQEVSDTYYGVTHYDWSKSQQITEDEADILIKLQIAKKI